MSRTFERIFEIVGWIQIFLSPTLFCAIIGAFIYFPNPTSARFIIAISITLVGIVTGAIYATHIWKTKGTIWFVSRVSATPELDEKETTEKDNDSKGGSR